tara:strand:- start:246 stop:578 length:333 start_codon:yes stop_codon:yes gene_type:complete
MILGERNAMRIGDLVKFSDPPKGDTRSFGHVLRFDMYTNADLGSVTRERIIEVQWNNGTIGWILLSRVHVVKDIDEDPNNRELTYRELEQVRGGMSSEIYNEWKERILRR